MHDPTSSPTQVHPFRQAYSRRVWVASQENDGGGGHDEGVLGLEHDEAHSDVRSGLVSPVQISGSGGELVKMEIAILQT